MNCNDLITRITNAIFRQEGMSPEHANPGNLRAAPWLKGTDYKIIATAGGFWVPTSRAQGIAGAAHVVALHIAEGDSLRKLISIWAPPTDHNDTESYIKHVAEWAKIPNVDLPLWSYIYDPVQT